ncbi:ribose transport system permease protein/AI-2 transport system permease protein [Arboricoccus pini]|uniref:Autoinducer 2 import system permease protein LsrC n=1 Tax=Arboricoccus pini TaxID=1963835 RepID=A0A212RGV5_9PROT|nr:ABC transporter permease [Arboricoccus pini]SNB71476.1 ribose transport system permease protein/AI-2 transport system permease protein [Arboricoccus pini]
MSTEPIGRELVLGLAILAACLAFALASPFFATPANALIIGRNAIELLLIGLGLTFVLAGGGIDVAVGMVMGLAAIAAAHGLLMGLPAGLALTLAVLAGTLLGCLTGMVVAIGRVPAIVATIGLYGVYRTAIFVWLGGQWLSGLPSGLTDLLSGTLLGLPVALLVVVLAYALAHVLLRRTPFGIHLLAVGHDEDKARLMGVNVVGTRLVAFALGGGLAGLAGAFHVATYRNVEMTIGSNTALDAIAAVILGGTSILGGRASLLGTMLGIILLRVLQNGLVLVGVPSLWQTVVTGLLLLGVLSLEGHLLGLGDRLRNFWRQPA